MGDVDERKLTRRSFIGLTPGVMVCFAITRYLQGTFGSRKGLRMSQVSSQITRVFR